MHSTVRTRAHLLGTTVLAGVSLLLAATPVLAQDVGEVVTVTGYRASLTDSTNAKRASVSFTDTVFAEDIGKFPDANIAESLQRIPGININREADGEGLQVAIRGLGVNFTKMTLNGNPIAVASTGAVDNNNVNREVDLNMFPTELFTQLTVSKSPTPDLIEGGLAGNVNMRSARPFDNPGMHATYSLQGTDYSKGATLGERGSAIISDTEGPFGALLGASVVHNKMYLTGWEDGNAGWYTPGETAAQCGTNVTATFPTCNQIGADEWTIPATVPAGISIPIPGGSGNYAAGTVIDQAWLLANNPSVTSVQLGNALLPRLGREMYERGFRDRYNGILSLEYRPSDDLHFYVDGIIGRTMNVFDRSDMNGSFRSGAGTTPLIPTGLKIDANGVTTDAKFYNGGFVLEARPYTEKGDFFNVNPGMTWQVTDLLRIEAQAYATRSHFFRDQSDLFVMTSSGTGFPTGVTGPASPAGGTWMNWSNHGGNYPIVTTNVNLNDPNNFSWASNIGGSNGRADLAVEKRYTFTDGYKMEITYGGEEFSIKAGGGYNNVFRNISAVAGSQTWQNAVCGDGPSLNVPGQANYPPCQGLNDPTPNAAGHVGGYPTYPGIGTGYTTGQTGPVTWAGSLIPNSRLPSELMPGPRGWVTVNKLKFFADSQYYKWRDYAMQGLTPRTLTGADGVQHPNEVSYAFAQGTVGAQSTGQYEEKLWDAYAEFAGKFDINGHALRYNAGMRWVETHENITSPMVDPTVTPQNTSLSDGGKYPGRWQWTGAKSVLQSFLPSVNVVYDILEDLQLRASASRTMSRANPTQMVSTINFGDVLAKTAALGNPGLKPFYSNNVDIGLNYYTGAEGYLAVTAFKKSVSGFTASGSFDTTFSYLANYGITYASLSQTQKDNMALAGCHDDATCAGNPLHVTTTVNSPGTLKVTGLEFDVVQPLDFATESMGVKGFGINGNVTLLSQASTGAAPTRAGGVPNFTYNATGYYENDGVMLRLAYTFTGKSHGQSKGGQVNVCFPDTTWNTSAHPEGCQGPWYYTHAHEQFDLSSSLKLSKFFGDLPSDPEVTFDIQNLTRAKLKVYDNFPSAVHSYYDPGSYYMFGVRGTF